MISEKNSKGMLAILGSFLLIASTGIPAGAGDGTPTCKEAIQQLLSSVGQEFEDNLIVVDSVCEEAFIDTVSPDEYFQGRGQIVWETPNSHPEVGTENVQIEWKKSSNNYEVGDYISYDAGIYADHAYGHCEKVSSGWTGSFWVQGIPAPCTVVDYGHSTTHIRYDTLKATIRDGGFALVGNDMETWGRAISIEMVELP